MAKKKKPLRDSQGRWMKGVSGNPKGRPHKYAKVDFGDLLHFKNTVLAVNTSDGRVMMTREAAVQLRLYQSAIQGNVHAQIFLARRFQRYRQDEGEILEKYLRLLAELRERKPTQSEERWMHAIEVFLRIVPNEMLKPGRKRRSRRPMEGTDARGKPDPKS
jgi:uncharacterized protein DUF5681